MDKNTIEGKSLSFEDWWKVFYSTDYYRLYPGNCFPSDEVMKGFIDEVERFSDFQINLTIRSFIVHSGNLPMDEIIRTGIESAQSQNIETLNSRFLERLMEEELETWEGITWILDLIPINPKRAIDVIENYIIAHFPHLSDNMIFGLEDSIAIIEAKYIDIEKSKALYSNIDPRNFEILVARLYDKMGYTVEVTRYKKDGGKDIIAWKDDVGDKQRIVIECKNYIKTKVTVRTVRELLGVVHLNPQYNKGILVTSSDFTHATISEFEKSPHIELINHKMLTKLLNTYLGNSWEENISEGNELFLRLNGIHS